MLCGWGKRKGQTQAEELAEGETKVGGEREREVLKRAYIRLVGGEANQEIGTVSK